MDWKSLPSPWKGHYFEENLHKEHVLPYTIEINKIGPARSQTRLIHVIFQISRRTWIRNLKKIRMWLRSMLCQFVKRKKTGDENQKYKKCVPYRHTSTKIRPKLDDGKWFHIFLFLHCKGIDFKSLFTRNKNVEELNIYSKGTPGVWVYSLGEETTLFQCTPPVNPRCASGIFLFH